MKKIIYTILLMAGSYSFAQGYPQMETMTLVPQNEPTSPIEGQIYYDVNQKVVFVYDGSDWVNSLEDTDNQILNLIGGNNDQLTISGGNTIDLSSLAGVDNSISETNQTIDEDRILDLNGNNLSIDDGNTGMMSISTSGIALGAVPTVPSDPLTSNHLTRKIYVDNKSNEHDEASEILFSPNGSIAATTVQAAIEEVRDEASGSGLTTEQEERIDNAGVVKTIAIAGDVTLTAENFDPSTVGDRGKKVLNTTTSDFELTLPDLSVGKTALFQPTSVDASFTIVPDVGVSFVGNGTDVIEEGFIVDSLNVAGVTKIAANTYSIAGYVKPYDVVIPNLFGASNAATDDTNSISGFVEVHNSAGDFTINSVSSSYPNDDYMLEIVQNTSGEVSRLEISHPASAGTTYDLQCVWQTTAATVTGARLFNFDNTDGTESEAPSASWETDNLSYTATSTGVVTVKIYFGANSSINAGEILRIAKLNVTPQ